MKTILGFSAGARVRGAKEFVQPCSANEAAAKPVCFKKVRLSIKELLTIFGQASQYNAVAYIFPAMPLPGDFRLVSAYVCFLAERFSDIL
jgi:hypothetical protein